MRALPSILVLPTFLLSSLLASARAQGSSLPLVSGMTSAQGAGLTRGMINANGTADAVWGVFSGGAFHYRVGFDLAADGTPASVGAPYVVSTPFALLSPRVAQGADLAVGSLGGTARPDLVLAINFAPSGANVMCYTIGWDMDVNGRAQSWSPLIAGPSLGWESQGAGCSVGDINRDGRPDLLLMANDNPAGANSFRYVIGWSVQTNGWPQAWSSMQTVAGAGHEAHGAAATVTQLDRDPRLEVVMVAQDNGVGADTMRYRIGWNLDASGVATAWGDLAEVHMRDRAAYGVGCYVVADPIGDSQIVFASAQQLASSSEFSAFGLLTTATVARTARRYRIVGDLHCVTHTHEEGAGNDRDETYFKVHERSESGATGLVSNKSVRLSDPHPEDYFQFFNGRTISNMVLWEGVLYPEDNAVVSFALLEQDNSNLDDLLRILPAMVGLATGIGAAIGWLPAASDFGLAKVGEIVRQTDGREFIGGLGVSLRNQNGRIATAFKATQNATLISGSFDTGSVTISMNGAGQYELSNLRVVQEPVTAGLFFEPPLVHAHLLMVHTTSPRVTAAIAHHAMANNWDDAVAELLGAFPTDSSVQTMMLRNLPVALRTAARLQGFAIHVPDPRAEYHAASGSFAASAADLQRVRTLLDIAISRLSYSRLFDEVFVPTGNRDWRVAADELLDAVYDASDDVSFRDATLLVLQHMPYALRHTFVRMGGNHTPAIGDASFFLPSRAATAQYR